MAPIQAATVRGRVYDEAKNATGGQDLMKKLALIVLAGASLLGTGIASAQYSFGDEGYWQRRGREYGLPCDNRELRRPAEPHGL